MKRASTSRKSRTDVKRLESRKDADIVRDKDAPAWTPEMFARAVVRKGLKPVPRKTLLSLRIDATSSPGSGRAAVATSRA